MTLTTVKTTALTGTITNAQLAGGIDLTAKVTGTLPIANGGTNSTATTFVNATTNVTGALPIVNGGTGGTSYSPGITQAQVWRLTTSFTGAATPIASNLEAADTNSSGAIGSAMTESSGIFTFPSTGIWLIQSTGEFFYNGSSRYNQLITEVTTNNSSYSEASKNSAGITQAESSSTYNSCMTQVVLDVTNTTNVKVRFTVSVSVAGVTTAGSSDYNRTSFSFLRIGDT